MNADDLRSIPEACDAAGNCVGWVPVPVATRDAIADLIDTSREVAKPRPAWEAIQRHREALDALDDA